MKVLPMLLINKHYMSASISHMTDSLLSLNRVAEIYQSIGGGVMHDCDAFGITAAQSHPFLFSYHGSCLLLAQLARYKWGGRNMLHQSGTSDRMYRTYVR